MPTNKEILENGKRNAQHYTDIAIQNVKAAMDQLKNHPGNTYEARDFDDLKGCKHTLENLSIQKNNHS